MMKPIVLLPLDERPVNVHHPQMLGEIAGVPVLVPPADLLSSHRRPAQTEALGAWLLDAAERASVLIVSVEMLGYGGLIASRTTSDAVAEVIARLDVLRQLRARHPALRIIGFNLITRISDANDAIEEPGYWADHGADLYRYAQLLARRADGQPVAEPVQALEALVPAAFRADFLRRRARNHAVNLASLQQLAEGVYDLLVLSSDDTSQVGLPAHEKRWLAEWARRLQLGERLLMYPGADEVGSVLVARAVLEAHGLAPTIEVHYGPPDAADHIAAYEDVPVCQTVDWQMRAAGLTAVSERGQLWLGVAAPVARRGERDLDPQQPQAADRAQALAELAADASLRARAGGAVAVADVAYPNGAEATTFDLLRAHMPLDSLVAYGAWNTAGNTIGTVLAQAALSGLAQTSSSRAAGERLLVHRLVEDWGYQTVVRADTRRWLQASHHLSEPSPAVLGSVLAQIEAGLSQCLSALGPLGTRWRIAAHSVRLPWGRLFEVDFDLQPAGGFGLDNHLPVG